MSELLVQVVIPAVSQLPEDVVVNTFSWNTPDTSTASLDTVTARMKAFYDTIAVGATAAIRSWIASSHDATQTRIKIYDRAQVKPRAPVRDALLGLGAGSGSTGIPAEVALCLSFRGAKVSGQVPARHRGRVYIGPLAGALLLPDTVSAVRPSTGPRNSLLHAGRVMMNQNDVNAGWRIWSSVLQSSVDVRHVWVDDAWDTQRRRGVRPVSRFSRDFGAAT